MGGDRIRHLLSKPLASGATGHFWNPSKTLRALGLCPEALGTDPDAAKARAVDLNNLADQVRRGARAGATHDRPGAIDNLIKAFEASEEYGDLKPRTQKDYTYYLAKVSEEFGDLQAASLSPKVIKAYLARLRKDTSVTWAYHVGATLRALLSWAVSENWITDNPAKKIKIKAPPKRNVVWSVEHSTAYIAKATEMGWHSIAAMAHVFDSIAQSPVDVMTLKRAAYNGTHIGHARTKTGVTDAPIPLFPEARAALDAYLEANPRLPEAPLFTHDKIGGEWTADTLRKVHRRIRTAANLPAHLQLQDFRRTAQTEAGAAAGTSDEIRALARHTTREAGEHYVIPDARYVESVQSKRLALRNEQREKVRIPE